MIVAPDTDAAVTALRDRTAADLAAVAANARRIVLARHTGEARARELEAELRALSGARAGGARQATA